MDRFDPSGVLGGQGRNGGCPVAAQKGNRLQVGLDTGSTAGVATGNRQDTTARVGRQAIEK